MHFASYKGHLDAINVLMRNGANKNALTATGLNMLHVAA
jgi:ankyrin repeat protein